MCRLIPHPLATLPTADEALGIACKGEANRLDRVLSAHNAINERIIDKDN
jgi:hypothetical protein